MKITHKVKIGAREFPVKEIRPFSNVVQEEIIKATAVQARLLAYHVRDLIIDKLLAYEPERGVKLLRRRRPRRLKENEDPPEAEWRKATEPDRLLRRNDRLDFLPERITREPLLTRKPFKHHPDLAPRHLDNKIKRQEDARKLIATGDYIRGIVVRREKHPKEGVLYVVTLANRRHKPSNIRLLHLAKIHEFGTREYKVPLFGDKKNLVSLQISARPHWRPAIREVKKKYRELGEEVIAETLRKALRRIQ